jgi:hypothetical protein
MLKQRVITAVILLLFSLPALFHPSPLWLGVLGVLLILAASWEWGRLNGLGFASADDTNENFYGERLNPREILSGKVKKKPEAVKELWKALEELDKKPALEGKTPNQQTKKQTTK